MSCDIRQASIRDLDALVPLFDAYRRFYGQASDPDGACDFLAERFRHQQSLILLARDRDGSGLGFVQLYPGFSSVHMARSHVLNDVFVRPDARGRGMGRALLEAAMNHARMLGVASLVLSTARDNHVARGLYESMGWQRDEQFHHYAVSL